ncbi:hypothetical protein RFI_16533 [Reticulomyxa filosa]|uniref:Uncharacterized protein n=1 Tax=Reticulomyxa filosa TaxID=46433 RepID=X6N332_RETFI|nr:hypothetical protein RFI_16533 [Reticulomyxa filosa]|eukprot:ETO20685.1 hypothetical protein RFI_16533 [Reticulomyxa filosa]
MLFQSFFHTLSQTSEEKMEEWIRIATEINSVKVIEKSSSIVDDVKNVKDEEVETKEPVTAITTTGLLNLTESLVQKICSNYLDDYSIITLQRVNRKLFIEVRTKYLNEMSRNFSLLPRIMSNSANYRFEPHHLVSFHKRRSISLKEHVAITLDVQISTLLQYFTNVRYLDFFSASPNFSAIPNVTEKIKEWKFPKLQWLGLDASFTESDFSLVLSLIKNHAATLNTLSLMQWTHDYLNHNQLIYNFFFIFFIFLKVYNIKRNIYIILATTTKKKKKNRIINFFDLAKLECLDLSLCPDVSCAMQLVEWNDEQHTTSKQKYASFDLNFHQCENIPVIEAVKQRRVNALTIVGASEAINWSTPNSFERVESNVEHLRLAFVATTDFVTLTYLPLNEIWTQNGVVMPLLSTLDVELENRFVTANNLATIRQCVEQSFGNPQLYLSKYLQTNINDTKKIERVTLRLCYKHHKNDSTLWKDNILYIENMVRSWLSFWKPLHLTISVTTENHNRDWNNLEKIWQDIRNRIRQVWKSFQQHDNTMQDCDINVR